MNTAQAEPGWILKIPPPIWTFAMLLAAFGLQRSFDWASVVYIRSVPLAIMVAMAGLALSVWGERTFAAEGTEIMPASASNKKLVTRGPFRFTRNPMYLGLISMTLGIALYAGTLPYFAVPVLVFLLCNFVFIPFEEAKMQRQFDDLYTDYRARVRRWL